MSRNGRRGGPSTHVPDDNHGQKSAGGVNPLHTTPSRRTPKSRSKRSRTKSTASIIESDLPQTRGLSPKTTSQPGTPSRQARFNTASDSIPVNRYVFRNTDPRGNGQPYTSQTVQTGIDAGNLAWASQPPAPVANMASTTSLPYSLPLAQADPFISIPQTDQLYVKMQELNAQYRARQTQKASQLREHQSLYQNHLQSLTLRPLQTHAPPLQQQILPVPHQILLRQHSDRFYNVPSPRPQQYPQADTMPHNTMVSNSGIRSAETPQQSSSFVEQLPPVKSAQPQHIIPLTSQQPQSTQPTPSTRQTRLGAPQHLPRSIVSLMFPCSLSPGKVTTYFFPNITVHEARQAVAAGLLKYQKVEAGDFFDDVPSRGHRATLWVYEGFFADFFIRSTVTGTSGKKSWTALYWKDGPDVDATWQVGPFDLRATMSGLEKEGVVARYGEVMADSGTDFAYYHSGLERYVKLLDLLGEMGGGMYRNGLRCTHDTWT